MVKTDDPGAPAEPLFACFNADGPYWDNIVRTVAYPSGLSYFRPFRYRKTWIAADLFPIVASRERHGELIGRTAFLCMSFSDAAYQGLFIPFREIEITHLDPAPDTHALFFKVGRFLDLSNNETFLSLVKHKPDQVAPDCLFFTAEVAVDSTRVPEDQEDEAWVAFIELVQRTANVLPIKDLALRSQYLRVRQPTEAGTTLKPELLYTSTNAGPSYGYGLNEGTRSEFGYLHRLPGLIGTELAAGRFHIRHATQSGNLELDKGQEEISGRYQPHFFTVTAKRPTGTYEELTLESDVDEIVAEDGTTLFPLDIAVPLKVKWHWWYRVRTRIAPLLVLFAAFVLTNLGSYYFERQDNPQLPALSGTAIIVRVIGSGLIAFVIWYTQQSLPRG
jgi:hypothetical protein